MLCCLLLVSWLVHCYAYSYYTRGLVHLPLPSFPIFVSQATPISLIKQLENTQQLAVDMHLTSYYLETFCEKFTKGLNFRRLWSRTKLKPERISYSAFVYEDHLTICLAMRTSAYWIAWQCIQFQFEISIQVIMPQEFSPSQYLGKNSQTAAFTVTDFWVEQFYRFHGFSSTFSQYKMHDNRDNAREIRLKYKSGINPLVDARSQWMKCLDDRWDCDKQGQGYNYDVQSGVRWKGPRQYPRRFTDKHVQAGIPTTN